MRYANSWVFSAAVYMDPVTIMTLALLGDGENSALLVGVTIHIYVKICMYCGVRNDGKKSLYLEGSRVFYCLCIVSSTDT